MNTTVLIPIYHASTSQPAQSDVEGPARSNVEGYLESRIWYLE
jgi:hypothetical protein